MKKKGLVYVVICIILLSFVFASCGVKQDGSVGSKDQEQESAQTGEKEKTSGEENKTEEEDDSLPIVKETLTLKILAPGRADFEVGNHMPVLQELEKRTNIHLDMELLPPGAEGTERFTAAMAAQEEFDLISWQAANFDLHGKEGSFIPLQDLIDEHAPDIKKAFDDPLPNEPLPYKSNVWAEITADDGNVYGMPLISASNAPGRMWGIREDWLEKFNLKMPETLDDLYNAFKMFRNNDPNGNGEEDEVPFIVDGGSYTYPLVLTNALGAHVGLYIDDKDDSVKYGPAELEFKEGLEFLNKLYKEKLLDNEYAESNRDTWNAHMAANTGGFIFVWPLSGFTNANHQLGQIDASYKFVPIAPVKGPKGHQFKDSAVSGNIVVARTAITSTNKYPIETMKYLNFLFTEEGVRLSEYGVEDLHYTMENGKPVATEYITNNPDGYDPETAKLRDGVNWGILPFYIGWEGQYQIFSKPSPEAVKGWDIYRQPGMCDAPLPKIRFTEDEYAQGPQVIAEINSYIYPLVNQIIMGEESLDKFDEFVTQMNSMGLTDALKVYNEGYKKYKSFGR